LGSGLADLLRRADPDELPDRSDPAAYAVQFEIPFYLQGTYAASRPFLHLRAPFVDSRFLRLAQRSPVSLEQVVDQVSAAIRQASPRLATIPTDQMLLGDAGKLERMFRKAWEKATFKLDYINNEGFPSALAPVEPMFRCAMNRLGLIGRHKHLHYRTWFQSKLKSFVLERLTGPSMQRSTLWSPGAPERIALEHTTGKRNRLREVEQILTLSAIERLLLRPHGDDPTPQDGPPADLCPPGQRQLRRT